MNTNAPFAVKDEVTDLINNIKSVIYIDNRKLEYLIAANIAGGHVILADSHGVGKTSLARALAGSIDWKRNAANSDATTVVPTNGRGASTNPNGSGVGDVVPMDDFSRIQCTVDLLPQDILGYNRIVGSSHELLFHRGPIFAHFVLCDEINLLTPKTQGSFFQAMEEQNVTVEGRTLLLSDPFFIIATMNLKGAHLFPLPAPQLDRFMIQLSMGFPGEADEAEIVRQHGRTDSWKHFGPVIGFERILQWKELVDSVAISPEVIDYIVACVRHTREHPEVLMGASPRTGVKVSRLARAVSLVRGEDYVTIDTIKEILSPAMSHRLVMKNPAQPAQPVVEEILNTVPVERRP
ncbi:MAG TPA: MoxR family ATPase [Spirochaetia bacterium]|nr:MoxR family ATPase [Spirochaetia bacterium]